MNGKLSFKLAGVILILLPSILIIFHVCVILGVLPDNIVWTGRITTDRTKLILGFVSIILNSIILICTLSETGYIQNIKLKKIVKKMLPFVFWWLVGNTIANLFSKSSFEVIVFTPILVILTVSFYIIWQNGRKSNSDR